MDRKRGDIRLMSDRRNIIQRTFDEFAAAHGAGTSVKTHPTDIPDAYRALFDQLIHQGFVAKVESPDDAVFGNRVALLAREETRIRFVRDRGQWSLEIAVPFTDEWFPPVVWMAHLGGQLPSPRRVTPQEESVFVARHWQGMGVDAPDLLGELRSWRDARAAQRWSSPPEVDE